MKPRDLNVLCILLLLSGCARFQPDHSGMLDDYVPAEYAQGSGAEPFQERWWESFDSPELNQIMQEALTNNLGLAQYSARLKQQAALARKTGAAKYPSLSGTGSAGITWPDIEEGSSTEAYRLGLTASYEIDLWGRINASSQAALENARASMYDLSSARITLSANIADAWLSIIAQQRSIELLHNQLTANLNALELLKVRQRNGVSSALEVYQQQQIVESTRAIIPSAELQLDLLKSQLAILLGRGTGPDLEIRTRTAPQLPPLPAAGLPADLLEKRPDIQAEYQRLLGKDYGVAIARADRLPTITLTGSISDTETALSDLLDSWAANLAAGLAAPLIDGGRRRAEVDYQLARVEEGVASYRQKVITAISEVDNALLREQKIREQLALQQEQLAALEQQLNEAVIRYRSGLTEYLNVLSALASKQNLERNLINTELNLYSARIELCRALGGSAQ